MMKYSMNPNKVASIAFCIAIMLQFSNCSSIILEVPQQIQVKQMHYPMVVEFYRPSCPHCQRMEPVYKAVANECKNGTSFYKVNCDNLTYAQNVAKEITKDANFQLNGVPTIVAIDKNGKIVYNKPGGMSKQELASKVSQLQ